MTLRNALASRNIPQVYRNRLSPSLAVAPFLARSNQSWNQLKIKRRSPGSSHAQTSVATGAAASAAGCSADQCSPDPATTDPDETASPVAGHRGHRPRPGRLDAQHGQQPRGLAGTDTRIN